MANQVRLMEYLQKSVSTARAYSNNPSSNTTNKAYRAEDITQIEDWTEFNIDVIMLHYEMVLSGTMIDPEPNRPVISPPRPAKLEVGVTRAINEKIHPLIRRSLRAAFEDPQNDQHLRAHTPLTFMEGGAAQLINNFLPDIAFLENAVADQGTARNRAPGDIKPSFKWSSAMRYGSPYDQKEFRQALSQVNFYAQQTGTRYGFLITELELVVFRRMNDAGHLQLSSPILFSTQGDVAHPQLTVLLALWYLGMLASIEQPLPAHNAPMRLPWRL